MKASDEQQPRIQDKIMIRETQDWRYSIVAVMQTQQDEISVGSKDWRFSTATILRTGHKEYKRENDLKSSTVDGILCTQGKGEKQ